MPYSKKLLKETFAEIRKGRDEEAATAAPFYMERLKKRLAPEDAGTTRSSKAVQYTRPPKFLSLGAASPFVQPKAPPVPTDKEPSEPAPESPLPPPTTSHVQDQKNKGKS